MDDLTYTGTQINYYFVCHRKLWLFSRDLAFENENQDVLLGRLVDEFSYTRKRKQVAVGPVKIDFFENRGVIHEVKKSNKIETAHIWQTKYYLYKLYLKGIPDIQGQLDYPKLKKTREIHLSREDREEFTRIFEDMDRILTLDRPPGLLDKPLCKKCAYYEFCYV